MNHRHQKRAGIALLTLCLINWAVSAVAETGVTDKEILLGISADETGPIKEIGNASIDGANAMALRINNEGGIHGRKLRILSLDDHYEPQKALANVKQFVEKDKVFAIFGNPGTNNSRAVLPYLDANHIPFLFPATGSDAVRVPLRKLVFSFRTDYQQDSDALATHLVHKMGIKDIGIILQDDSLGQGGLNGMMKSLAATGAKPLIMQKFAKGATEAPEAIAAVQKAKPHAVYFSGTASAVVRLARALRTSEYKPVLVFNSTVDISEIHHALGDDVSDILMSSTVPLTNDTKYPAVKRYQADMKAAGKTELHAFSLETYMSMQLLSEAMKAAGKDLTREKLASALEGIKDLDLGGIKVSLSPTEHQAMKSPFLFLLKSGKPTPVQ